MEPVKISSLELENVKRIRAVQIVPTADGLTVIGGRNGQGKTSVLDAIAWALGGNRMKPDNPNRDGGATPAKLHVELSNGIVVERRGKNGTLHVTDTTGMRGTQKLLDEFLSALALDLPRFLGGTDKDRTDALLHTLGIDRELAAIDGQIRSTFERRTLLGREAKSKRAHAESLPHHEGAPAEPVSITELIQQQQEILARNAENQKQRERVTLLAQDLERVDQSLGFMDQRIDKLETELEMLRRDRESAAAHRQGVYDDLEMARKTAEQLADESTSEVEDAIANVERTNARVRDNQRRAEAAAEADEAERKYQRATDEIEQLRASRTKLLDGAPLPLDGLTIDEDGHMTYRGQTWDGMSSSERLRVGTAIVRATKPECGFVLVDGLEQLDPQTLTEFGEWARSEGLQVIGTRVGTDDACTIVIEDGRVEGQDMADPVAPDPRGEALEWEDHPKTWGGESF